ncbi:MAG: GTP-binding protein [Promethearchaeota archaeon]
MTIGTSFAVRNVDMGNVVVKLQIWDLAGQPHFGSVRPLFYQGSTGIIYVYSVTDRASFEHLAGWMEEVRNHAGDISGILIGNKSDLTDERVVSREEALSFSKSVGLSYLETSAKTDLNVGDAFRLIAEKIIKTKWPGWEPPAGMEAPVITEAESALVTPEEPEIPETESQPDIPSEPDIPADDDFSSFTEESDEKPDEEMPEILEELLTLETPEPEETTPSESPSETPDSSTPTDIALIEKSTSELLEFTDVDYKELPLEEFEVRVIGVLRRLGISENGVFGSYILSLARKNERDVVIQSLESLQED